MKRDIPGIFAWVKKGLCAVRVHSSSTASLKGKEKLCNKSVVCRCVRKCRWAWWKTCNIGCVWISRFSPWGLTNKCMTYRVICELLHTRLTCAGILPEKFSFYNLLHHLYVKTAKIRKFQIQQFMTIFNLKKAVDMNDTYDMIWMIYIYIYITHFIIVWVKVGSDKLTICNIVLPSFIQFARKYFQLTNWINIIGWIFLPFITFQKQKFCKNIQ